MAEATIPEAAIKLLDEAVGILNQEAETKLKEAERLEAEHGKSDLNSDAYLLRREANVLTRFGERISESIVRAGIESSQAVEEAESRKSKVEREG